MATGKIRADTNFVDPHPHAQTRARARARARNPQRIQNNTHTRYPRIPAYPWACPYTRKIQRIKHKIQEIKLKIKHKIIGEEGR